MSTPPFEFAVVGATPAARLIAGLLAERHGRRVVLAGTLPSPFELPRGIDLSIAPVTRPQAWAVLKATSPEVVRLLNGIGRGSVRKIAPLFVAQSPSGMEALAHVRHVAMGYGHGVDRLASASGAVYRFRDVGFIDRGQFQAPLQEWLARLNLRQVPAPGAPIAFRRDGTARWQAGDATIEAEKVILADDDAILMQLSASRIEGVAAEPALSVLTEPLPSLGGAVVLHADTGVTLLQQPGGSVVALAPGKVASAFGRIGSALSSLQPRRAGQLAFSRIVTPDGGPVIGALKGSRALVVAGFGLTTLFLALALARYFAGKGTEDEVRFLADRQWGDARGTVSEWTTAAPADAA